MYLLSGAMSLHHLVIMTKPSLSCLPCFLCMLAIPIFPFLKVEEFLIYLSQLLVSFEDNLFCVAVLLVLFMQFIDKQMNSRNCWRWSFEELAELSLTRDLHSCDICIWRCYNMMVLARFLYLARACAAAG